MFFTAEHAPKVPGTGQAGREAVKTNRNRRRGEWLEHYFRYLRGIYELLSEHQHKSVDAFEFSLYK